MQKPILQTLATANVTPNRTINAVLIAGNKMIPKLQINYLLLPLHNLNQVKI